MTQTIPPDIDMALSHEECLELDAFLADPAHEATTMDLSMLEGFLAAVVIGPSSVMPSQWLPWIWDIDEGTAAADFDDSEEINRVLELIMRHYNSVASQLLDDATGFMPVYALDEQWDAIAWCDGFLLGTQFDEERWGLLMDEHPDWFAPFVHLGTEDGLKRVEQEDSWGDWVDQIVPSLAHIQAKWLPLRDIPPSDGTPAQPIVREFPKIGRNDPCPCGSGKKYKKCCGAAGPVLH